jgi:hypothetical protein
MLKLSKCGHDFNAEIPCEKFNLVMRGASYEKKMTSMYLKEIEEECCNFGVNVHQVVDLFHSIMNQTSYSYELYQESVYDKFCHTPFPNRFEVLDDFSGIQLHFVEEEGSIMDSSMSEVFNDSYHGDGEEQQVILHLLNDTIDQEVIDRDVIHSNTCSGSNVFQESLEIVFNEYKTLENKYVMLQKEYSSLQDKHDDLQLQNQQLHGCLIQRNEEIVNLKEEYTMLKEEKSKKDHKLKEFMASLGI